MCCSVSDSGIGNVRNSLTDRQIHAAILENFPEGACVLGSELELIYSNGRGVFASSKAPRPEIVTHAKIFVEQKLPYLEEVLELANPEAHYNVKLARVQLGNDTAVLITISDITADIQLQLKMFQRGEELSILYELSAMETENLRKETIVSQVVGKLSELTALEQAIFVEIKYGQTESVYKAHNLSMAETAFRNAEQAFHATPFPTDWIPETSVVWRLDAIAPEVVHDFMRANGIVTCVDIPILVRGKPAGLVILFSPDSELVRVPENLRFFDLVGKLLGSALERAQLFYELEQSFREIDKKNRLFSDQLQLAQKLQSGILEIQFPRKPQIEFAIKYIPSYQLGGDFYDIFEIRENRIGVLIADVCGHGVSSALITTFLKAAARDLSQSLDDPSEMMNILNQKLVPILPVEMFVSAFYLICDLAEHKAYFSNGGHPLPIYYDSRSDSVAELDIPGIILSISETSRFETRSITYNPGDKIFLFTDGLYEIKNAEGDYMGVERIQHIIHQFRHESVIRIVEEIMKEVYRFADRIELEDDLNLIAIDLIA